METGSWNVTSALNKDMAISISHRLCPSLIGKVDAFLHFIFTGAIRFGNSQEIASYACLQVNIGQVVYPALEHALAMARIIGGTLGVVGSILALIIFTRPEYDQCVTMTYHRFINFIEIINALILVHGGFDTLYQDFLMRFEAWVAINVTVVLRFRGSILFMVNMIVLWMACERISACWTSRVFNILNTKRVAWSVIAAAVLIATACVLPNGFTVDYYFDNATGSFQIIDSPFVKTESYKTYAVFYAIFTLAHAFILLVTSVTAVYGFVSMAKRKRKLVGSTKKPQTNSDKELLRQYSSSLQLSVLQMCETIPFTLNEIVVAAYLIQYNYIVQLQSGRTAPWTMSYEEAVGVANANELSYYMRFVTGIGVVVSHCLRFYLYIIFSTRVRKAFRSLIGKMLFIGSKSTDQVVAINLATAKPVI